jgi:very-short-patch-repair endonuclease
MKKDSFELLKISYKQRSIDLGKSSFIHPVLTNIENASITFLCEVFKNFKFIRQHKVDNYFIDLYFPDNFLAIECDEQQHKNNKTKDLKRQEKIEYCLKCKFYRYEHCDKDFSLAVVTREIMEILILRK